MDDEREGKKVQVTSGGRSRVGVMLTKTARGPLVRRTQTPKAAGTLIDAQGTARATMVARARQAKVEAKENMSSAWSGKCPSRRRRRHRV